MRLKVLSSLSKIGIFVFGLTQIQASDESKPWILSVQVVEPALSHEGPPGKTRIQLFRDKNEKPLFDQIIDGQWDNLGYIKQQDAYLLGGKFAYGGWLTVQRLSLLSVQTQILKSLEFEGWSAISGMLSPDGKYWAFVGEKLDNKGNEIEQFGLFVLSTKEHKIVRLADAPAPALKTAPPPKPNDMPDSFYWSWGGFCCDGYFEFDPEVMEFPKSDSLSVDYGYDPAKKNQPKKIIVFDLSKMFP